MNGVNHSLKSLLYAYNILLASSSNIPLSCMEELIMGFLTFPKYKCKPGTTVGEKNVLCMEEKRPDLSTVHMKKKLELTSSST